jgi:hypothetical protein
MDDTKHYYTAIVFTASLLCGCETLKYDTGLLIFITLTTRMRAANVADFYMTKYWYMLQNMLAACAEATCYRASAQRSFDTLRSLLRSTRLEQL